MAEKNGPLGHESIEATTMNEQLDRLTISNPEDAVQAPNVLLPNFPLPRELRDRMYGFLLYHEHVRYGPYRERDISRADKVRSDEYEQAASDVLSDRSDTDHDR